jgi:hypothetical protein
MVRRVGRDWWCQPPNRVRLCHRDKIDEKFTVSLAIADTASIVTSMKARPYRSVIAIGYCSRTEFQISIALLPQAGSSQS